MADSLTAQVRNIANVTTAVANGDLSSKITVDANGEILELKGTINTMVDQLAQFASEVTRVAKEVGTEGLLTMADSLTLQVRNILDVAIAVAKGDLTRKIDIDVKGELLELKNNINTMIHVLSDSDAKNKEQNWIKDGVSMLNKEVLEKDNFLEQVQIAITGLARYVNAGMGALYIYDPTNQTLKLESSYAYVQRNSLSNEFSIGEGIVGQVAYEKKPILLTDVGENSKITTATTEYKALNTYTAPLIFKEELIGVVEIASYTKFDELHIEYFNSAFEILSGSLYASLQASSTKDLLIQSQTQSKELEEQSLQLKHQNKELEIQRAKMDIQRKELEKKNKDLESAQIVISRAKELEVANKYKSEFLANMSHELRTPLNSMLLLSDSLANSKKLDIERVNKQASIIHEAGVSLLELINDVLDLSKIEANLMTVNIEEVHIKPTINEITQLFYPQAQDKDIKLLSYIDEDALKSIITDKAKLMQIIKNFISNALKFTDQNGRIDIKISKNDSDDREIRPIKISIIDNGIGIEEDKIELIFQAFRQAEGGTSRKYGGTGLGLSISKEFTELLGGRLEVKSKLGEGSSFTIYLPKKLDTKHIDSELVELVEKDNHQSKEKLEKKPTKQSLQNNTINKQIQADSKILTSNNKIIKPKNISEDDTIILIVDDDERFSYIILDKVNSLGYKGIVTHDGSTAVSLAREYKPKAILLDLVLPGFNGLEILRVLKSDLETRHIPVKVISFNNADYDTRKLGAVDFIKKPISPDELDSAISNLINFANDEEKNILVVQNQDKSLIQLLSDKNIHVIIADTPKELLNKLNTDEKLDCIVIDITSNKHNIFDFLDNIKKQDFTKPIIIYTDDNLSKTELKDIKEYVSSTVLKAATNHGKLIEEVSLFLHTIKESLNEEKQHLLDSVISDDTLLAKKKVLMVDDDVRNIFALSATLEEKEIDIITAQNGQEALETLQKKDDFDIILMDIMMPVMDGYEAMKEIRKIEKFKNLPIIALTAKVQKDDKQKCINAGANDYLSKPIDNKKLIHLLKVWTKKV